MLKKLLRDTCIKANELALENDVTDEAEEAAERAEASLTPAERLHLAVGLMATLPHGATFCLDLGSSAAALEWLLLLGAEKRATPHIHNGPCVIEVATLRVGALEVRAQTRRPLTPADLEAA